MALELTLKKQNNGNTNKKRGKLPSKRTINLSAVNKKKFNFRVAIPATILIIGLAYLFGKYMVYDRLKAVDDANGNVIKLQELLDTSKATLDGLSGVDDTYAHYTLDGMTQDELNLVDRISVLELVSDMLPEAVKDESVSWSLNGNILTIELYGKSLEHLNQIAKTIDQMPIVDSCTITTANKNPKDKAQVAGHVKGKIVIYLQNLEELAKASGQNENSDVTLEGVIDGALNATIGGVMDNVRWDPSVLEVNEQ